MYILPRKPHKLLTPLLDQKIKTTDIFSLNFKNCNDNIVQPPDFIAFCDLT